MNKLLTLLLIVPAVLLAVSCSKDSSTPSAPIDTPTITVSSPNGGESWNLGESHPISWSSQNLSGAVNIEINRTYPSASWETLAAGITNGGNWAWIVAGTATIRARIRIVSSAQPSVADTTDADFTVADTAAEFIPEGMVRIPAGGHTFSMGSATGPGDEQPIHSVTLTRDFWLDSTEVTQAKYEEVMSQFYPAYTTPSWHPPYGVGSRYPAYSVYWGDAVLYCNALSRRDGLDSVYTYSSIQGTPGNLCELDGVTANLNRNGYRLPTEAEWEFACRGGTTSDYSWGRSYDPYPADHADSTEIGNHAVWFANAWILGADSSEFGSHPVASKLPNPYGLYDMMGNDYEWCHDWYGEYSAGSVTDPAGPGSGDWHSLRGGSWGSHAVYLRSSNRTFSVPDYLYYFVGFRVARPVLSQN